MDEKRNQFREGGDDMSKCDLSTDNHGRSYIDGKEAEVS